MVLKMLNDKIKYEYINNKKIPFIWNKCISCCDYKWSRYSKKLNGPMNDTCIDCHKFNSSLSIRYASLFVKVKNEIGNKYGRLTVLSRDCKKNGKIYWNCMCDCGKTISTRGTSLRSGVTTSCNCYKRDCNANYYNIPNEVREFLDGNLLSDASYVYRNDFLSAYFVINTTNFWYAFHIYEFLVMNKVPGVTLRRYDSKSGNVIHDAWSVRTATIREFGPEAKRWYDLNQIHFGLKKIVPADITSLTPTHLFWWYIGDGYLNTNIKQKRKNLINFATNSFIYNDVVRLKKMLEFHKLNSSLQQSRPEQWIINLCGPNVIEFLKIVDTNKIKNIYDYKSKAMIDYNTCICGEQVYPPNISCSKKCYIEIKTIQNHIKYTNIKINKIDEIKLISDKSKWQIGEIRRTKFKNIELFIKIECKRCKIFFKFKLNKLNNNYETICKKCSKQNNFYEKQNRYKIFDLICKGVTRSKEISEKSNLNLQYVQRRRKCMNV